MRKNSLWKRALQLVFDLLYPISCIGCGQTDIWLCPKCLGTIKPLTEKRPLITGIDKVIVATNYDDKLIQKAIHLLKYKSVADLAKPLAKIIEKYIPNDHECLLIPVPLHPRRQRSRGFNQAELLAREIVSEKTALSKENILIRKKNTMPQMKLDREDRLNNLNNAFSLIQPESVKGKNVILLDDVLTTGKTLQECAKIIHQGNPKSITALVLAHGK